MISGHDAEYIHQSFTDTDDTHRPITHTDNSHRPVTDADNIHRLVIDTIHSVSPGVDHPHLPFFLQNYLPWGLSQSFLWR
jgi:hypothetical protein